MNIFERNHTDFIKFFIFLFSVLSCSTTFAGIPVWELIPLSNKIVDVPVNGIALKQYRVINNSKSNKKLVYLAENGLIQRTGHSGDCSHPFILSNKGSCILSLQISSNKGKPLQGQIPPPKVCIANSTDNSPNALMCYRSLKGFTYKVFYPLSIQAIPEQAATANVNFQLNLSRKIAYYDENVKGGIRPIISLSPDPKLIGLRFDSNTGVLQGRPITTGVYRYRLQASNKLSKAPPRDFVIKIAANPHDRPRFGQRRSLAAASPGSQYDTDLTTLLAKNPAFNAGNPVSFAIAEGSVDSDNNWLTIKNGTHLVGRPDARLAGKTVKITLIAHSNTGGNSEPTAITIPIAYDPALRPVFSGNLSLEARAGADINYDLRGFIRERRSDGSLQVVIDDVKPAASWLKVDRHTPTRLTGMVPPQAVGVPYTVTVHATNKIGGRSDKVQIPLNIATDPDRVPRFNAANPTLPMLYPGQPFSHDFIANSDIYPSYNDAPYTVSFAKGFPHPSWLKLVNNRLYADTVPDDCYEDVQIFLVIKNTPGGESKSIPLDIYTMY